MELTFDKYQGTGNDFILMDNRNQVFPKNNTKLVQALCNRRFGIGADGLILLEEADEQGIDFKMVYFNADGKESSMCGNGGRCIISFARQIGIVRDDCKFSAVDGLHEGRIYKDGRIGLRMKDVYELTINSDSVFLDTGSPHHIEFIDSLEEIDIVGKGSIIRKSEKYQAIGGTNVNFVKSLDKSTLRIRTFERGVEGETLSCGTGATAAAIAAYSEERVNSDLVDLITEGGSLQVRFKPTREGFTDIWLEGPAEYVFKGSIQC